MSVPVVGSTENAGCEPATKPATKSEYVENSFRISKVAPPRPSIRALHSSVAVTGPATRPPAPTACLSSCDAAAPAVFFSSVAWYAPCLSGWYFLPFQ